MKRIKNVIKTITVMCVVLVCYSCNNDEMNDIQQEYEKEVYAKVENASEFNNVVTVKLMVWSYNTHRYEELARCDWNGGRFTIGFPRIVDSIYLISPIHESWIAPQPTVIISDDNIKIADACFVGIDKYGYEVAKFSPIRIDVNYYFTENEIGDGLKYADTEAFYTFVDSDVIISGYTAGQGNYLLPEGSLSPGSFIQITNYSIKWKKGWNTWFFSKSHTREGGTMIETEQWSTTPIDGLKWYGCKLK